MEDITARNVAALGEAAEADRRRIAELRAIVEGLRGAVELLRAEVASLRALAYSKQGTGPSVVG